MCVDEDRARRLEQNDSSAMDGLQILDPETLG